jgi:thiosulfate/3-mercaptopyruvate sulfurtransferase
MHALELPDSLVDVVWLQQHLEQDDLIIFDASWHMPVSGRNGAQEWAQKRIPGARFFDFDQKICRPGSDLPHMMPDETIFTEEVRDLGLNEHSAVVIYDSNGLFSSPRVWWMLRAMGFHNCALLDGGLPAWEQAGYTVESERSAGNYERGNFVAKLNQHLFVNSAIVMTALHDTSSIILDARPAARFHGEIEEPRAGLRKGHMPGAKNLPFPDMFNLGLLKSGAELKQIFAPLIVDQEQIICSCGSGITACVIAFGAHRAGYENLSIYDASWCEWGLPGELPVVID